MNLKTLSIPVVNKRSVKIVNKDTLLGNLAANTAISIVYSQTKYKQLTIECR